MAFKQKLGFSRKDSLNVEFDGVVLSSVRAKLVEDFIKHILYQRQQIPLPFEQVKRCNTQDCQEEPAKDHTDVSKSRNRGGPMKLDARRRLESVEGLEKICRTLEHVFTMGDPINQVVVSLGATVMSPKEVYILNFPTGVFEGKVLGYNACKTALFRQLIMCDFFPESKPLKTIAKLTVMVHALRSCKLSVQNLHPKITYKIPDRGQQLSVNLLCRSQEMSADLTKIDDTYMDISGIEPLKTPASVYSVDRTSRTYNPYMSTPRPLTMSTPLTQSLTMSTPLTQSEKSPDFSMVCEGLMELDLEHSEIADHSVVFNTQRQRTASISCPDADAADYIWYQVPFTMKGYREKATKVATMADLWV